MDKCCLQNSRICKNSGKFNLYRLNPSSSWRYNPLELAAWFFKSFFNRRTLNITVKQQKFKKFQHSGSNFQRSEFNKIARERKKIVQRCEEKIFETTAFTDIWIFAVLECKILSLHGVKNTLWKKWDQVHLRMIFCYKVLTVWSRGG